MTQRDARTAILYSGRIQILLWDCPECRCVHWTATPNHPDRCRHCGTEVEVVLP